MNKLLSFILLLCMIPNHGVSQSVTVNATIDSLQILIGEHAKIKLQVSFDEDKIVHLPTLKDTIVSGVEILDIATPDTQLLNQGKRMLITQEYTITSFDSALYYLPPMEVMVDSQIYRSKPLALKVYTMEVPLDPENPEDFFGSKSILGLNFDWKDWIGIIGCLLLSFPIVFLLKLLIKYLLDDKPIIRKVRNEPKLSPYQIAMQDMKRIKEERIWQKGYTKEYYSELTNVVRLYIKGRFGFNALEMTSSDIMERLLKIKDLTALKDLNELFTIADLVKFAKYNPLLNENDANLITAISFIEDTKQEIEANVMLQPIEVTVLEKRSLQQKILLGVGVLILSVILIVLLIYIFSHVYNFLA